MMSQSNNARNPQPPPGKRVFYIGSNYKLYPIFLPTLHNENILPQIHNSGESSTDPSPYETPVGSNTPTISGFTTRAGSVQRAQTLPPLPKRPSLGTTPTTSSASLPNLTLRPSPMLLAHEYAVFGRTVQKDNRRGGRPGAPGLSYGPWAWGGYMSNNWRGREGPLPDPSALPEGSRTVLLVRKDTGLCARVFLVCMAVIVIGLICVLPVMVIVDKVNAGDSAQVVDSVGNTNSTVMES